MAKKAKREKPSKPHPTFPLRPHPSGQWEKRHKGKSYYFGKWEVPGFFPS